jgi:hypothetical protein
VTEQNKAVSVEQVVDQFIAEVDGKGETLQRYLASYPQFASQLLDLSRELMLLSIDSSSSEENTAEEDEQVEAFWTRYREAINRTSAVNPFAGLAIPERRDLAKSLGIKLQVIALFAEAKIALWTVPSAFLKRMATSFNTTVDELIAGLSVSGLQEARSYKSDVRPTSSGLIDFARAIEDAGASDEERRRLLYED